MMSPESLKVIPWRFLRRKKRVYFSNSEFHEARDVWLPYLSGVILGMIKIIIGKTPPKFAYLISQLAKHAGEGVLKYVYPDCLQRSCVFNGKTIYITESEADLGA